MKLPVASARLSFALVTLLGSMAFAAARQPTPSAKVVNAYSKYVCFMMMEVAKGTPKDRQVCEKDIGESLVQLYPRMTAAERLELEQMPANWARLQKEWARLDETQRDQVRTEWARMIQFELEADTATGGSGPARP
jgi:hypothetical protein